MQKSVLWGAVATSLIGLVVVIAFLVYPAEKTVKKTVPIIQNTEKPSFVAPEPVLASPEPLVDEQARTLKPISDTPQILLPSLNNSDDALRGELVAIDGSAALLSLLVDRELIRKFVRAVYGISEGYVVKEYRPIKSLPTLFRASPIDAAQPLEQAKYEIAEQNEERYRKHIAALLAIEPAHAAKLYSLYLPLFQQAYDELGLPEERFHNVTKKAMRALLSLPAAEIPERSEIVLIRPSVMYVFEDKQFESSSGVEKLKIRVGQKNALKLDMWLRSVQMRLEAMAI